MGDELLSLNGQEPRDVIDYQRLSDAGDLSVLVRRAGAPLPRVVRVETRRRASRSGIEVSSAVFDRIRTCDNHCAFCFIYQLPKGCGEPLPQGRRLPAVLPLRQLHHPDPLHRARCRADPDRAPGPAVRVHPRDGPELRASMLRNPRGPPACAGSGAARWRDRGARPGRGLPGGQRRDALEDTLGRHPRPVPRAGQRGRRAARAEPLLERAHHAAAHARRGGRGGRDA